MFNNITKCLCTGKHVLKATWTLDEHTYKMKCEANARNGCESTLNATKAVPSFKYTTTDRRRDSHILSYLYK